MHTFPPSPYFRLMDKDSNVLATRVSLGQLRNYAQMSTKGRDAVIILSPTGELLPVRTPRPTKS